MATAPLSRNQLAGLEMLGSAGIQLKALPSGTPTAQLAYQNGGLFAACGFEDAVISAVPLPQNTILRRLRAYPNMNVDRLVDLITEATAGPGDAEPNGVCDDPPNAGTFLTCAIAHPYGRVSRQSRVVDLSSSGEVKHRGINTNLRFIGGVRNDMPIVPTPGRGGTAGLTGNVASAYQLAWRSLGLEFMRKLGPMVWSGNTSANTGGGGYKEFKGLNSLATTAPVDAVDGSTACAILKSDVRDFAGVDITTSTNMATLVVTLTNMIRNRRKLAEDSGLSPVTFFLSMRWGMWTAILEGWPCSMATYRCNLTSNAQLSLSAERQDQIRQEMRNGMFLWVDGEQIPVQIDDFITETRPDAAGAPNTYQSDIWLLPETFAGGYDALFMEYINFAGANGLQEAAAEWGVSAFYDVTDGGMFAIHHKPPNNWCVQDLALIKPRLILLTPQFAGRLQNVKYTTLQHEISPIIGENSYLGGGVAAR